MELSTVRVWPLLHTDAAGARFVLQGHLKVKTDGSEG